MHPVQPTLEKSDSLGTKQRRKRLWDYLGRRRSKQTRRNLVQNVIAWIGCNRSTDSNKIEVIVLDDQKSRELRRIERRVWLFICTIVRYCKYTRGCGHGEMRNKQLRNRRSDITQGWGVLQSLISPSKGNEKKKKLLPHGIFGFWSPIQVRIPQNRAQLC